MKPGHKFVDLSHAVEHGMLTYPGLPGPLISDFLSGFRFFAVPVKIKNFGSFPVRAFAIVEN